jgi:hypothetical protein
LHCSIFGINTTQKKGVKEAVGVFGKDIMRRERKKMRIMIKIHIL